MQFATERDSMQLYRSKNPPDVWQETLRDLCSTGYIGLSANLFSSCLTQDANGYLAPQSPLVRQDVRFKWHIPLLAFVGRTGAAAEPDLTQALSVACLGPVNHWTLQTSEECIHISCPRPNKDIYGTYYKDSMGPKSCSINIRWSLFPNEIAFKR